MSCTSVKSNIIEIRRIHYFFVKEFPENPKVYVKGVSSAYCIVAAFHNPLIHCDETVISELYSRDPSPFLRDNTVNVYYSQDGDLWIDPIVKSFYE